MPLYKLTEERMVPMIIGLTFVVLIYLWMLNRSYKIDQAEKEEQERDKQFIMEHERVKKIFREREEKIQFIIKNKEHVSDWKRALLFDNFNRCRLVSGYHMDKIYPWRFI